MDENDFFVTTKDIVLTILAFVGAMIVLVSCVILIVTTLG